MHRLAPRRSPAPFAGLALLVVAGFLVSCVSGGKAPAAAGQGASAVDAPSTGADEEVEIDPRLEAALARVAATGSGWQALHLLVECNRADSLDRLELFTSGVALWNEERQFRLSEEEVASLLRTIHESPFLSFEPQYGGKNDPAPESGGEAALRLTCWIVLELDGAKKQSIQLSNGRQSPELRALAEELLEAVSGAAADGVAPADLADGLRLLRSGELAGEAFRFVGQRKPEPRSGSDDGWLLRLRGRQAIARPLAGSGFGDAVGLELAREELEELAGALLDSDFAALPTNLWAEHYTDLGVQLLGFDKEVQARQFAGMERDEHGHRQAAFDRLYAVVDRLARRVLADGEPTEEG